MKTYDVIVVGSGSGMIVVEQALAHGQKAALVDRGPLGGTCLNVGCIPSKLLIVSADRVMAVREAAKLGVKARTSGVDFPAIMARMREHVGRDRDHSAQAIRRVPGLDYYDDLGRFVDDRTMEVKGEKIRGDKVFLVSGARPAVPQIEGIDGLDYLTNETVLGLDSRPESMIIVGGGYVAAEYAHFFSAMGTRTTVVQRAGRLVRDEEPEVSDVLRRSLGRRVDIRTGVEARAASREGGRVRIAARELGTGKDLEFRAEKVLLAAGRTSNADLLDVGKAGVDTDAAGYIKVNDYLETNVKGVWALGDATGRQMFKHAANRQAELVWRNAFHGERLKFDFGLVPHAVFSDPEIAAIGLTEAAAASRTPGILVGKAAYSETARGQALLETEGFAKIILDKETGRILGFHIIGPDASILIQEVVVVASAGRSAGELLKGLHIHPALSEVVAATLSNLEER